MNKSKIVLAIIAVAAVTTSVVLGINLVSTANKYEALFNYHTAECEYIRYENEPFDYLITCEEATQYELEDYINCSKNKGTYCTVDDLI